MEDAADRAALLSDFGVAVRLEVGSGEVSATALYRSPTRDLGGIAGELVVLDAAPSLLLRTESLAGLRVEDPVEVLEGAGSGRYIARSIAAEDDGELSRVDLAEA